MRMIPNSSRDAGVTWLVIAVVLFLLSVIMWPRDDPNGARRVLEDAGYTQIIIAGPRLYGCSKEDWWRTGFAAKGPTGNNVTGVVCAGWLKGATIRFN